MKSLRASLVVNPAAGSRMFRKRMKQVEALLGQRSAFTSFVTQKRGDALAFAREISDIDLIIVAGGDGTFNEVINGMLSNESASSAKIPIAIIPLGTTNVLAKELGIPSSPEEAVDLALTGTPKKISLGRIVNTRHLPVRQAGSSPACRTGRLVTRYFCLMAGIGFDGETVFKVNTILKKICGKSSYILSGLNTLIKYNPPLIQVKTQDGIFSGYTVVVGNARCYAGDFYVTPEADITEPMLDLCLLKTKTRRNLLGFISGIIFKKHLDSANVLYRKYTRLEISSRDSVYVQIDGDYFSKLPVNIDVVKNAVSVVQPERNK